MPETKTTRSEAVAKVLGSSIVGAVNGVAVALAGAPTWGCVATGLIVAAVNVNA